MKIERGGFKCLAAIDTRSGVYVHNSSGKYDSVYSNEAELQTGGKRIKKEMSNIIRVNIMIISPN